MVTMSQKRSQWFETWSSWSSLHGLAWYGRTSVVLLKVTVATLVFAMMATLCGLVAKEAVLFAQDDTISNSVEWETAETMTYPNVTVCNAKYFHPPLLREYNISDELASYLLLSMDASMKKYIDFIRTVNGQNIDRKIERLEADLKTTMHANNFKDVLEIFHALAVPCDTLVTFCEAHRTFYLPSAFNEVGSSFPSCCDAFFNPKPFFSQAGTCYTTNSEIVETFPSVLSSLKIWLVANEVDEPSFDMYLLGSDANDKTGIRWVLSHKEHPARVLIANPEKLDVGTSAMVGLSKIVVDRRDLPDACLSIDTTFWEKHNMERTQLNCHLFGLEELAPNCSTAAFAGWNTDESLPVCSPTDILANNKFPLTNVNGPQWVNSYANSDTCPSDCYKEDFSVKVATGQMDTSAMKSFMQDVSESYFFANATNPKAQAEAYAEDVARRSAMLHLYFSSFEYPTYTLHRTTITDFLSKVGGWMGLAMGGSVISCLELLGLLGFILWQLAFRQHAKSASKP